MAALSVVDLRKTPVYSTAYGRSRSYPSRGASSRSTARQALGGSSPLRAGFCGDCGPLNGRQRRTVDRQDVSCVERRRLPFRLSSQHPAAQRRSGVAASANRARERTQPRDTAGRSSAPGGVFALRWSAIRIRSAVIGGRVSRRAASLRAASPVIRVHDETRAVIGHHIGC